MKRAVDRLIVVKPTWSVYECGTAPCATHARRRRARASGGRAVLIYANAEERSLAPYSNIHPPHLDGFLRSRHGEFRLTRLPGGRTRLEGTTSYENRMWPRRLLARVVGHATSAG